MPGLQQWPLIRKLCPLAWRSPHWEGILRFPGLWDASVNTRAHWLQLAWAEEGSLALSQFSGFRLLSLFWLCFVWRKEMLQVTVGTCPFKVNLATTLINPNILCSAYKGEIATHKSFPKMTWEPCRCAEGFTRAHHPGLADSAVSGPTCLPARVGVTGRSTRGTTMRPGP